MDSESPQTPVEGAVEHEAEPGLTPGMAVAQARRGAGLTRRELADRLGERLWTVEEWEAGRKPVPPEKAEEIAAITGARLDLLTASSAADQPERGGVEAQQRWIRSLGPVDETARSPLTVDEICDADLPRSVRGFEPNATRRWLAEVASHYGRLAAERDELRSRLDALQDAPPAPDDYEQVVAECDKLRQRLTELAATAAERDELRHRLTELEATTTARDDYEQIAEERDALQRRVATLDAALEERKDYADVASARAALEREVAELWEIVSAREDYDAIVAERNDLRNRLAEAEASTETEQALSRALLAASRAGEELVKEAQAEADAILAAARAAAAEAERHIEEQRRRLDAERAEFLETLRAEALETARDDLAALQRDATLVGEALAALADRIHGTVRLRLQTAQEEPPTGELLEDLQARTDVSETAHPVESS